MKIGYYIEFYKGQYLVKSKTDNSIWGNHDAQDRALAQIIFLDNLKNPNLFKEVVLEAEE